MSSAGEQRLVIAGGGLAGCLAALAMARLRPEVAIMLVEAGEAFGGNHIWSFFDADVDAGGSLAGRADDRGKLGRL